MSTISSITNDGSTTPGGPSHWTPEPGGLPVTVTTRGDRKHNCSQQRTGGSWIDDKTGPQERSTRPSPHSSTRSEDASSNNRSMERSGAPSINDRCPEPGPPLSSRSVESPGIHPGAVHVPGGDASRTEQQQLAVQAEPESAQPPAPALEAELIQHGPVQGLLVEAEPVAEDERRDAVGDQGMANHHEASRLRRILCIVILICFAIIVGLVVMVCVFLGVIPLPSTSNNDDPTSTTISSIMDRGVLRCGFLDQVGFSTRIDDSTPVGFQVDLCRAVAAAIFGEDGHTEAVFTDSLERFKVLQNDTVDVSLAHISKTLERDIYEPTTKQGYEFSIPYLYNELRYGGVPEHVECLSNQTDAKKNNETSACVADITLCVLDGSTHLDTVRETWPTADIVEAPSVESKFTFLSDGRCSVVVGEKFDIVEETVRGFGYTGPYLQSEDALSLEPLAAVTREGDAWFSDFVNWVIHGLMVAEETRSDGIIGHVHVFGEAFESMFVDMYAVVGHYGDIYETHLEPLIPRSSVNQINLGDSGLMMSFPFGNVETGVVAPTPSGAPNTLQRVFDRTLLRCGVARVKGFAIQDPITQEWSGLDVDYCRALSAAIFSGDPTRVVFIELSAKRRFVALASDEVDVLSRFTTVTLPRDVKEPASGTGFTFTKPTFYDGLVFGGIPPYDECVLNLDASGETCRNLRICVEQNTTFSENLERLFPPRSIVGKLTNELTEQGLNEGDCNMIAGGRADVAEETIRQTGRYTGEYKIVPKVFAKDPLALVTRDDDPQWSSFVAAIVSATLYAEEMNATRGDASVMPTTQLFGTRYNRMFRNAISAVGNYGEIYGRNLQSFIPRDGLNLLNARPFSPQHYPYPTQ